MDELASDPNLKLFTLDLEMISFLMVSILLIKKSLKSYARSVDILPTGRTLSFGPSNKCFAILKRFLDHDETMLLSMSSSLIGLVLTFFTLLSPANVMINF